MFSLILSLTLFAASQAPPEAAQEPAKPLQDVPARELPPAPPREGWSLFSPPSEPFSVMLPGTPAKQTRKQPLNTGGELVFNLYMLEKSANDPAYIISSNDIPFPLLNPDQIKLALDNGVKGAVRNTANGKLIEEKEISLQGAPGRELRIEAPKSAQFPTDVTMVMRFYAVKSKLIQTLFICSQEQAPQLTDTADYFLNSLRLIPDRAEADAKGLASAWKRYTFEEDGYSILFPIKPSTQNMTTPTPNGETQFRIRNAAQSPSRTFMSSFNTTPEDVLLDVKAALDGGRNGALERIPGAKLLKETDVQLGDIPGRELLISLPRSADLPLDNARIRMRMYLGPRGLYQALFIGTEEESLKPDVQTFLESLQISSLDAHRPEGRPADLVAVEGEAEFSPGTQVGWTRATLANRGYSIEFPGKPTARFRTLETPLGPNNILTLSLDLGNRGVFVVTDNDSFIPASATPEQVSLAMDRAKSRLLEAVKGKLKAETPLEIPGRTGSDLEIELPPNPGSNTPTRMSVRAFLIGTQNFMLQRIGPATEVTDAEIKAFFDSFQVLKSPDKP